MSILTREQAFGQPGNPASDIYYWPEDSEVVASAQRFNAINFGLYDTILQVESEAAAVLAAHTATLIQHTTSLTSHTTALADRYTKSEADATASTLIAAIQSVQTALDNLNTIYQTDTEAAAALAALSLQWNETSADFQATVTGWLNLRYTKTETDALLNAKANVGDSYTKTQTDDLLSVKAASSHNHTLKLGNGVNQLIQMGSQERLDIEPGYGIELTFDDNLNKISIATDLAADIAAATSNAVAALRDSVATDGDTLAKLRGLIAAIETALGVDDASLDTLQEVISTIKADQSLIDSLTTGKVSVSDIIDGLTSTETAKPLSANQGRALKTLIDGLSSDTQTALADRYTKAQTTSAISTAVAAETTRAQTAETTLGDAIVAETTRAQTAEALRYSKTEVDALLLTKAPQSTTYSKTETDALLNAKAAVGDIIDGLTSTETAKPLSANQGRALKLMVDNVLAQTWIIATSPKRITQDMILLAEQNGLSIGPIAVAQNINVTVQPDSIWRII
jgi:hypothetical protein